MYACTNNILNVWTSLYVFMYVCMYVCIEVHVLLLVVWWRTIISRRLGCTPAELEGNGRPRDRACQRRCCFPPVFMYVCMYVCMYVSMRGEILKRGDWHKHKHICALNNCLCFVCMLVYTCIYDLCMSVYISTSICMYVCMYVCMYALRPRRCWYRLGLFGHCL